jgi:hypothetical protein
VKRRKTRMAEARKRAAIRHFHAWFRARIKAFFADAFDPA